MKDTPAFPCENFNATEDIPASPGLTKRELLAAMAMQGIMANSQIDRISTHEPKTLSEAVAENAVNFADALIAELSKAARDRRPAETEGRE